jgi:hypothetical protein
MVRTKAVALFTLLVLALSLFSGCAGNSAPSTGPSAISIQIARAAADIGLSVYLQKHGVSPEDTATIISELRKVVDAALAGQNIREGIADPILWQSAKDRLVSKLAKVIVEHSKYEGVPLVAQESAELLVSSLMDAFRSSIWRQK